MQRINKSDLELVLNEINKFSRKDDGEVGAYLVSSAYGGYKLERIECDKMSMSSVTSGYDSKKILYGKMQAFLSGLKMSRSIWIQR